MSYMATSPEAREGQLLALEEELNDFAYIVSHDIAAKLRHISGFSDLLTRNIGGVSPSDQELYVGLIRDAAQKCETMLEQLRAYSRAQKAPLNIAECDVARLLDLVRLQLSGTIKQCNARFTIGPLKPITADPDLLAVALGHLLDNAVKFHRASVTPHVTIEQNPVNEGWKMTISDNGIGIPEAGREKLFSMFQRGHAEGAYPGTGAGLTIARRILRRHGGDIRFAPSGNGACVEITLPRHGEHNGWRFQ